MTTRATPTLLYVAVEPRDASDRPALIRAMTGLADDEPGCGAVIDAETGQTLVEGVSEAQLDAAIALLRGRHALELNVGEPQIAYRETLARRVETDSTHRTRAPRRGEVGRVASSCEGTVAIPAKVPLANLLGYREHLRRLTEGKGRVAMTFSHFAPIEPPEPPSFPAASALRIA